MDLKEKVTNRLKEQYSNLGFPQDVLTSVAGMAVVGLSDDASDDVIAERVSGLSDMLKSFQRNADKRVSDAKKAADEIAKGGKGDNANDETNDNKADEPAWFKAYRERQEQEKSELQQKIDRLVGESNQKSFDDKVTAAAKKIGLRGDLLVLAKAGLSPDMDDVAIADKLGAVKKTLMESGAKIGSDERSETMTKTEEDAARAEAAAWVKKKAEELRQDK